MASGPESVTEFLDTVSRTKSLWASLDLRVLAAKIGPDWHNLLTRCYLDSRPVKEVVRFEKLPATGAIACWQRVLPLDLLPSLLESVAARHVHIDALSIKYEAVSSAQDVTNYRFNPNVFHDISEPYHRSYPYWSCHALTAHGTSIHDLLQQLPNGWSACDHSLRTCDVPYDGVAGVARYFVGLPDSLNPNRVCSFEVFAPLEALFAAEKCRVEQGRLQYVVRVGSERATHAVALRVCAVGGPPLPLNEVAEFSARDWKSNGGLFEADGSLDLQGRQVATAILCLGPFAVHRLTLLDRSRSGHNPLLDAYRVFDADLEALTGSLGAEGSRGAAQFDSAVARLLLFAGFQVNRLSGDHRLTDAPDLIAHTESGHMCLALECTTGSINSKGKLGKLVSRVTALQGALSDADVRGALVTSLERSRLSDAELAAAAQDNVIVLAREDLQELLTIAEGGAPIIQVLGYLESRIPRAQST